MPGPTNAGPLIGLGLPQLCSSGEFDGTRVKGLIRSAEEADFHSVWVTDQPFGPGESLEPLSVMSYAAAVAQRMVIGAAVIIAPVRHPVHLARALATLDHLTDGRLIVGLGLGGPAIYKAFGLDTRSRGDRLSEATRIIRSIWEQDQVNCEGVFWTARGHPPPRVVQQPHPPIWLAATTRAAMRRAVTEANGWIGAGTTTSQRFIDLAAYAQALIVQSERPRSSFTIAKRVFIGLTDVSHNALSLVRRQSQAIYADPEVAARSAFIGTSQQCVTELRRLVRSGADLLILNPLFDEEAHLEALAKSVIPALSLSG